MKSGDGQSHVVQDSCKEEDINFMWSASGEGREEQRHMAGPSSQDQDDAAEESRCASPLVLCHESRHESCQLDHQQG